MRRNLHNMYLKTIIGCHLVFTHIWRLHHLSGDLVRVSFSNTMQDGVVVIHARRTGTKR